MRPSSGDIEARRQQVLLAPASDVFNTTFDNVSYDPELYDRLLADLQRLRGRIYLRDGAIRREHLCADGRHKSSVDPLSWHIVTLDQWGSVVACARFQVHHPNARFEHLGVGRSSMAKCPMWGHRLRSAVEFEQKRARLQGCHFIELGGWALDDSVRYSMEAFRIALASYAWSGLTGGAIGITTATFRNHSADILRKLGGRPVRDDGTELPRYFDPQYDCDMQILTFETGGYAPRFHEAVVQYTRELAKTALICSVPTAVPTLFPSYGTQAAHASAA